jgi:tryptophan halogenase
MKLNLDNIIIVGGGTSGWLTALYLNEILKDSQITLIESNEIGILGAGEGTTGNIINFLNELRITEEELVKNCDATFKDGINFTNWTDDDTSFFHPINFIKYPNSKNYSYHFNARLFASYLKKVAIDRGIIWKEGVVTEPLVNDNNEIIGLKTNDTVIECDFVFDCSGFRRLLIGNHYKSKWNSYEKYLKLNSAIPFFLENNQTDIHTQTESIAMKNGWMWQIPLQSRKGCGYIFDINEISEDEAKQEVNEYLGHLVEFNKLIKFEPGSYETVWIKNCIAVGLSGGFLEPLEATSIMSQIIQLKSFNEVINGNTTIEKYNDLINQVNIENMVFIYYHYFGNKSNSSFWNKIKTTTENIPYPLNLILDKNNNIKPKDDLNNIWEQLTVFTMDSWNTINNGLKNKKNNLI